MKPWIEKYLSQWAEVSFPSPAPKTWDCAIALPVLADSPTLFRLLDSLANAAEAQSIGAVAVLVVNNRNDHSIQEKADNQQLLTRLGVGFQTYHPRLDLLVVDRSSPGLEFPEKQGVGLARKLGCDQLLHWYHSGHLRSPWLRTTDADVEVPVDYWSTPPEQRDTVAFTYPYRHEPTEEGPRAQAVYLYEIWLRYYEWGLHQAGSPYAFTAIGSLICFHAEAYAKVRGFPRRLAAEDFYLLNKLVGVGHVTTFPGVTPVRIQDRPSTRVPFGTGQGTRRLEKELLEGRSLKLYHPQSFFDLKATLLWMGDYFTNAEPPRELDPLIRTFLEQQGVAEQQRLALENRPLASDRTRHAMRWFDGLKTLQLMHWLRDQKYGELPYDQALILAGLCDKETSLEACLRGVTLQSGSKGTGHATLR